MVRIPVRHARMHRYTPIGGFRLSGTVFGTTGVLKSWSQQRERSGRRRGDSNDIIATLAISLYDLGKMRKYLAEMIVHAC
jgi:hypothetical protein